MCLAHIGTLDKYDLRFYYLKKKKEKRHCTIHHIHRQILKVPRTLRHMLGFIKVSSRHEVYSQVVSRCNTNESYFVIQLHSPANLNFFCANKMAPCVSEGTLYTNLMFKTCVRGYH